MKHIFIVNPAAGKGRTLKFIPEIREYFDAEGMEYTIEVTEYPGHATEIAARYASKESCRIYSVGGDGTLNEVLNGMAGGKCTLAVIPSGSGNDFIRSITDKKDFSSILKETVHGSERTIDLAKVNGRYYLNISSMGFDALVVYNMLKFKKVPLVTGSVAYILGILSTIIGYSNNDLKVTIDGNSTKMKSLLVAVANGKYCGGGMLASPHSRIDDGLLDICLIGEKNRITVFKLFPKYMKGTHGEIEGVSFVRGKKVEIESSRQIAMHVDGEVSLVSRAEFEIIPGGIKIITPA